MNAIVLASHSLDALHVCMVWGFMLLGVGLSMMGAVVLAWALSPISPSDMCSEAPEFHSTAAKQRYAETQYKLACVRAERARMLQEPSDSTLATQINPTRVVIC